MLISKEDLLYYQEEFTCRVKRLHAYRYDDIRVFLMFNHVEYTYEEEDCCSQHEIDRIYRFLITL